MGSRFLLELTVIAIIAHPIEIGCTGNTGLGGHEFAHGIGSHSQNVGLYNSIVCIGICHPEPSSELTGRNIKQPGQVGEHHEPGDMVTIALFRGHLEATNRSGFDIICNKGAPKKP